ncbi:putative Histidine kinase [Candidatus Zixiibacteriota bacterium]|nr:putative Histidine kinase [candidate division Zixibacteria bacterium]
MKRLYFRFTIGVIIIMVLSFYVPREIFHLINKEEGRAPRPQIPFNSTVEQLKGIFESAPASQYHNLFDSLSGVLNYPLMMVDTSDPSIPPELHYRHKEPDRAGGPPAQNLGYIYIPLNKIGKMLVLGPMPRYFRNETQFFIVMAAVILAIAGIAGFIMVVPLARNLRTLELATSRFGEGQLDSRAAVKSRDAIGSVANRFNSMAESIQQMIQRERQLLQSVSHELRTPIARIRFSLGLLEGTQNEEERKERLREIDGEIDEINQLVGELLDYNRFQSESMSLNKQTLNVADIIGEVIKRLQDFQPDIKIDLHLEPKAESVVVADKILFRRAMQNLVANALRYAKSTVTISYRKESGEAIVEISDDGPGVPPEMREQIMKPFYRIDPSGTREAGGVGLGLAIVSRILELHEARISVEAANGGGAKFVTRWPGVTTEAPG